MRIIGGKFRGQKLFLPKTAKTRPLSELARESLFNLLGNIEGVKVLDAYAGSGAVGLEALSRGASAVTGIEIAKGPAKIIRKNIEQLGVGDQYLLIEKPIENWLSNVGTVQVFDLIYAGPPFGRANKDVVKQLAGLLNEDGLLIVETSKREQPFEFEDIEILDNRTYGESTLTFYKKPQAA